ncbi:MAG: Mut7-C RNAse domain-containing protein [Bacteroidota bacterium]
MEADNLRKKDKNHSPVLRKSVFRFYEELNDHLPESVRKNEFTFEFTGTPSVKNSIQAIGIPHGEVDLILVNGEPVDFDYRMQGGEKISVYPVFESLDISPVDRLRPEPLREPQFVVDVNLGKLALKLRLLGFDTLFRNDFEDDEIIRISLDEKRIILTRDKGILKQNVVKHGYFLRNDDPKKQMKEVVDRLQLHNKFQPFSRCVSCNGELQKADKKELNQLVSVDTLQYYNEFWQCSDCSQVYWKGSHFGNILRWIEDLKQQH